MSKTVLQENINHLALPSQSSLAEKIGIPGIDQRYISYVVCGRKSFSSETVREIEKKLSIPAGWLARYPFDLKTMLILRKYRSLEYDMQLLFDEFSLYMIEKELSMDTSEKGN